MATFEQVMALATLPETRLPLCLDARLQGELDSLLVQLGSAGPPASLGERSPAAVIQERIDEVVEAMRAAEVTFVIRAMGGRRWTAHFLTRPERDKDEPLGEFGERLFPWMAQLVSASCLDPQMSPAQVEQLVDSLHADAWNRLQNACTGINMDEVKVPNFAAVSELTPGLQTTLPLPSSSGSPTQPSPAPNGAVRRRTPTKRAVKPKA